MFIYNLYSDHVCSKQYGEGGLLSFYKATVPLTVTFFFSFSFHFTRQCITAFYSLVCLRSLGNTTVLVLCPLFPVSLIMTIASCMSWILAGGSSRLVVARRARLALRFAGFGSWLVMARTRTLFYVLPGFFF